ncbi:hypothetical protein PYCCODRAFT_1435476 [Trametes coccinea BRFM310]|uniref:Uncharacterized protein n=1 Tax=Trametes coccinea (strain BRFM310) TaxID=1353009 RepID=A0A1Y2IN00_TRAC3|nr:hypothetical protein PYCCODRAFT_1435476 [Trametes coccinea BRFM310]
MSTLSTPLQRSTAGQANCCVDHLFSWLRKRVDAQPTVYLRGVEAMDAMEIFEDLQRHAGVLEKSLRQIGRWLDAEVVVVVVAIIVAVHRQTLLLNGAHADAGVPFICKATTLDELLTCLRDVEMHWASAISWARTPEGEALLAEDESLTSKIRTAMSRSAKSTRPDLHGGEELSAWFQDVFADLSESHRELEDEVRESQDPGTSLKYWLRSLGLLIPRRSAFEESRLSPPYSVASESGSSTIIPDIRVWFPSTGGEPNDASSSSSSTALDDSPEPRIAFLKTKDDARLAASAVVLRHVDRDQAHDLRHYSTPSHPFSTSPTPSPDRTPEPPRHRSYGRRRALAEDDDDDEPPTPPKPRKRPRLARASHANQGRKEASRYHKAFTPVDAGNNSEPCLSSSSELQVVDRPGFRPNKAFTSSTATLRPPCLPRGSEDEVCLFTGKHLEEAPAQMITEEQSGPHEYDDASIAELPAGGDEPAVEEDEDMSSYETADDGDWQIETGHDSQVDSHPVLEHASARASTPPPSTTHRMKGKAVNSRRCWDGIMRFVHHIFT